MTSLKEPTSWEGGSTHYSDTSSNMITVKRNGLPFMSGYNKPRRCFYLIYYGGTTIVFETMFIHAHCCFFKYWSRHMFHAHFSASRLVNCGRKGCALRVKSHLHLSTYQGHERCDVMWWHHGVLKQCSSMSYCCYKNVKTITCITHLDWGAPPPLSCMECTFLVYSLKICFLG